MSEALNEALSALADGRATPADWACVRDAWDRDPALRERWALWQCAADGLRSTELPGLHRDPEALLAALHADMGALQPTPPAAVPRRRDWLAPLAVAAGFVAVAVGVSTLRLAAPAADLVAAAPAAPVRAQALAGTSFAQAAAGRPALHGVQEAGLVLQAPPEIIEWPGWQYLPEPPASRPRP